MKSIKMKGKTIDEAVDSALQVLGLAKDKVDVKIINEAESGMLGMFGGKEAEVEVSEMVAIGEEGRATLQEILDKMGFVTIVSTISEEGDFVELDIKGEDMGRIIGREGATIDSLQYLASIIMGRKKGRRIRVVVDAEGYRGRREKNILDSTREIAENVDRSGKEAPLPPMSAAERRIIHLYIQEKYPNLTSVSRGEGRDRQVIIAPKGQ